MANQQYTVDLIFSKSTTSVLSNDGSDDGQDTVRNITTKKPTCYKSPVVLPYIKGVSEQIRRVFKQYDVLAYFKPMNNLLELLVRPKAKIMKEEVIGAVGLYHIRCESYDASLYRLNRKIVKSTVFGA